ncbi:ABC transporter permease [Nocardiopsis composta]|uniref:2-aminoethylphosphonate transport system permease protein n=1 Tax=Nocardiopsis composta TaxID=157465 RepID=A0A7W8QI45_9ACTN|nr:ABC transporter permease subunit [Nocardiopsis composta]MBB5430801.1 2-aminoethylphosphonate transport system permease protein [Nocardiopsis composta]
MLVHSRGARAALHTVFLLLFLPVFALPFAVVLAASFAGSWSGALPSSWTLDNYAAAGRGESLQALNASLVTAAVASSAALAAGTWAALAAQRLGRRARTVVDAVFMLPVAVPSVVVGLALLVAFSAPPLLLNGTRWIVMLAHAVLVTAFAYQSLSAALARLDPAYEQAAAGLGGRPGYVLWKVKLPLLLPSLGAAAGLCFALSMGELSATMMLYPPDWLPLPVRIFASTDRGALYTGAALAVLLMAATLAALVLLSRVRSRAEQR